jgi:hypothetical protein
MTEGQYQAKLIKKLNARYPGCIILKNDPSWQQGIPDLLILYDRRWAALEVKIDAKAKLRPNQSHYIETLEEMSFASIIYPEIEDEVLRDLQFALGAPRRSRVSKSEQLSLD